MRPRLLVLLLGLLNFVDGAHVAQAGRPISYSGTLLDAQGVQRHAIFTGTLDVDVLTGKLDFAGNMFQVTAAVAADWSLSGTIALPDGTVLGAFKGTTAGNRTLTVVYHVGGTAGTVSVPALGPDGLAP